MHDVTTRTVGALIAAMLAGPVSAGDAMPKAVGSCTRTVVVATGTRFSDKLVRPKSRDVDDGTSIELKNGVYGVSYAFIEAVANSRIGHPVLICLVAIPKGCPKGDDRGKTYATTDLRIQESWTLGDSQHMCGGA